MAREDQLPESRDALERSTPSLTEVAYQGVLKLIRDGEIHPGERVKEASVAKMMGVSRTPVREAIRRLQAEGRVVLEAQRGAVVAELNRQEMAELFAVRERLEGIASGQAAQHASDAEVDVLEKILEETTEPSLSKRELNQLNWKLHFAIYHGAHNRFLIKMVEAIADSMALLRGSHHIPEGRPGELYGEHKRIVDAIRARDPDAAEAAARAHIRRSHLTHLSTLNELTSSTMSR
ncbi:GntR family transcriptional regulator [Roseibium algae]|uniref:GntR family transcriptional regulator n=1 Tax=Roseibium algae TaxID=3123038 RepID=A0ABU8TRI5_9HYPH